jgi:Arc/MetJ-type ribon-helix-helix transcriptional regulator
MAKRGAEAGADPVQDRRNKVAVSIRMPSADVRKVKRLAERIGVRESEVIRFAVKMMLGRLGPLCDGEVVGRNLVPVFVESGAELLRFFDLDSARLETIINEEAAADQRVDRDDIALLAMTSTEQPYAALKLNELSRENGSGEGFGDGTRSLRRYLYDKYVYRQDDAPVPDGRVLSLVGVRHD